MLFVHVWARVHVFGVAAWPQDKAVFERLTTPKAPNTDQKATTILQKSLSLSGTYRNNGLLGEVLPACVSEPYKDPIGTCDAVQCVRGVLQGLRM